MLPVAVTQAHGISRSVPADRTGNLPFRTGLRNQQYRENFWPSFTDWHFLNKRTWTCPSIPTAVMPSPGWSKKCKTKLERTEKTEALFQLIERAEKWLKENTYTTPLLKWETDVWEKSPLTSDVNNQKLKQMKKRLTYLGCFFASILGYFCFRNLFHAL